MSCKRASGGSECGTAARLESSPRKEGLNKWRLILDLSAPDGKDMLNSWCCSTDTLETSPKYLVIPQVQAPNILVDSIDLKKI